MPLLVDPPSTSMFSSSFSTAMANAAGRGARPSTTIARETLGSVRGVGARVPRSKSGAVRDAIDALDSRLRLAPPPPSFVSRVAPPRRPRAHHPRGDRE